MSFISPRHPAFLAIAAAGGLLLSLVLLFWVNRIAAVQTVPVAVVTQDVPAGVPLSATMIKIVDWPDHLKEFDAIATAKEGVGRVTREALFTGEPVLSAKLWAPGEQGTIEQRLQTGERALSVDVNEMVGVDPETLPGNYVDLIATPKGDATSCSTAPVAERLRVLAVDREADLQRSRGIRQLTLAVTPEQARAIDFERTKGSLTALLRNAADTLCLAPTTEFSDEPKSTAEAVTPAPPDRSRVQSAQPEIILGAERVRR